MTDDRSPRLAWTEDGAPRSGRFDDVYFSREDGLAESRAVFLAGCGLPEAWRGRQRFTVAELGFGTGLNIAALLDLWRREGPADGRLSIFSIEGFPLSRDEAARALGNWPELADALNRAGIYDYSIFLDEETMSLFAVLRLRPDNNRAALPHHVHEQRQAVDLGHHPGRVPQLLERIVDQRPQAVAAAGQHQRQVGNRLQPRRVAKRHAGHVGPGEQEQGFVQQRHHATVNR